MSSFFKASCTIFWLVWVISLAYMIGVRIFEQKYVVRSFDYDRVSIIMDFLCITNIILAFVGCVFVKCDISHILCFACYTLPSLILGPTAAIYGTIMAKQLKMPGVSELYVEINTQLNESRLVPDWLVYAELDYKCCGVISYKDYKTPKNYQNVSLTVTTPRPAILIQRDIPKSCCLTGRMGSCNLSNLYNEAINNPKNYSNEHLLEAISKRGCLDHIVGNTEGMYQSHFVFFIIHIVSSLMMTIVYMKNWCSSRYMGGTDSDHSLDVEEISLVDLYPSEAQTVANPEKIENIVVDVKYVVEDKIEPQVVAVSVEKELMQAPVKSLEPIASALPTAAASPPPEIRKARRSSSPAPTGVKMPPKPKNPGRKSISK